MPEIHSHGAPLLPPPPSPAEMAVLYARLQAQWHARGAGDLWVFGYASLIWNPGFVPAEQHLARVFGWHRAPRLWSRRNRGTPEQPGLVCALIAGGSCQGVVMRIPAKQVAVELPRLWEREMPNAVYTPRFLNCHTPGGGVTALAFTLARSHPAYTGELPPAQLRAILAHASGCYGSTHDYLAQTLACLRERGMDCPETARLLALAAQGEEPASVGRKSDL